MEPRLYGKILSLILFITVIALIPIHGIAVTLPGEQGQAQSADILKLQSEAALLMDAGSGQVLYEKNAHERLPMASITKIMTMDLVMEALDAGQIKPTDLVRVSQHAAGLGGSQIWLEEGEEMTVDDMMKAVAVNSANDAAVALAEFIAGTEEAFVKMMNDKAKALGMNDTNFVNCHGLHADDHYTSAYDVALMSRELIKHEGIFKYTSIWMDWLRDGKTALANTNKLIRTYGADGLKTGSTELAKYCLSATAKKNGLRLIAVILGAPTSKIRFDEATKLLDYGFNTFVAQEVVKKGDILGTVKVNKGKSDTINGVAADTVSVLLKKNEIASVEQRLELPEVIEAPVQAGQKIGKVIAVKDGQEVGSTDIISDKLVEKTTIIDIFKKLIENWI